MTKSKQQGLVFHLVDVLFNIVVIVAIVAAIRTFLVSPFQVEGIFAATSVPEALPPTSWFGPRKTKEEVAAGISWSTLKTD